MDWPALTVSLQLALGTVVLLLPLAFVLARLLAWKRFPGHSLAETLVALPLVLPPTVLGYYLLTTLSPQAPLGGFWQHLFGRPLVFSFEGLLLASLIANLPFAVQPMQRALAAIPHDLLDAASCCGLSRRQTLLRVELPLAWPGVLAAGVLVFAHTLGEFGVVLMVGGNLEGVTRTASIAIYDRMQAFDERGAGLLAAVLVGLSMLSVFLIQWLGQRGNRNAV